MLGNAPLARIDSCSAWPPGTEAIRKPPLGHFRRSIGALFRPSLKTKINALFSSDIGHFDVPDMREVLEDAHGLVTEGLMSEADFRAFTFTNPAHFWTNNNPSFFANTAVEKPVRQLLMEETLADVDAAIAVREGRSVWRRR